VCAVVIFCHHVRRRVQDSQDNIRLKQRATAKRDLAASHIRRLHASATAARNDPTARSPVLTAVQDLNNWWSQYSVESDALLNVMVELDEIDQFSPEADAAIYALVQILER